MATKTTTVPNMDPAGTLQPSDLLIVYQTNKLKRLAYSDLSTQLLAQIGQAHDGREIQLQNNGTFLQYRYTGDTAWTNLLQLSTITGTRGSDGNTIRNGSGVPSNSLGVNGDYYIDTQSSVFYGPKSGGLWPVGVSIIGAPGTTGADGKSAYQVALDNGFVGTEAQWLASLQGNGSGIGTINVVPNTGLNVLSNGTVTTLYNTTIGDAVNSVPVGGAGALPASTWKTKSLVDVLDTILFPDQAPTYTVPTLSASVSLSGLQEVGSSVAQVVTLTATKNDAGAFTALAIKRNNSVVFNATSLVSSSAAAIAAQYGYADPNNPNLRYQVSYADNLTVPVGTTSWTGTSVYSAGVAKRNNKNALDTRPGAIRSVNAPQAGASDLTVAAGGITGIYPFFWGKSSTQPTPASIAADIQAGNANKVLADSTGTVTITPDASAEYVWVACPVASATKTKWYNTALNQGNIGAGQFILAPITYAVTSPDGYWTSQGFKIYISNGATNTSGSYQLQN